MDAGNMAHADRQVGRVHIHKVGEHKGMVGESHSLVLREWAGVVQRDQGSEKVYRVVDFRLAFLLMLKVPVMYRKNRPRIPSQGGRWLLKDLVHWADWVQALMYSATLR